MQHCCNYSMTQEAIFSAIRAGGGRITKIRREIIEQLARANCFQSQAEILAKLNASNLKPNRSTIFRELQFLSNNRFIIKSTLSNKSVYELPRDHHHHLICLKCRSVKKVRMKNHLKKQESQIAKDSQFSITGHSLEFYGYCRNCQP